jgi:hypothetical protein
MSASPLKKDLIPRVNDNEWLPPIVKPYSLPSNSRGLLFKDERLLSPGPRLFGNHSWYFHAVTRQRYRAFVSPNKFWGVIAPSWTEGKTGEWQSHLVIVRPIVLPGCTKEFIEFVREISYCANKPIIFKQVHESYIGEFIALGCRKYRDEREEGWSACHPYDDQAWPEVVLNIDGIHNREDLDLLADLSTQAIRSRHRFEFTEVDFQAGSTNFERLIGELIGIFVRWRERFARRHQICGMHDFVEWNLAAINRIAAETDHRLFITRHKDTAQAVGFCYLTPSTGEQMDLALSFCDLREHNAHKLLYRNVLSALGSGSVRYVNMGGSEEYSLYCFKQTVWKNTSNIKAGHLILDETNA